jgi:hypothetical protein
MAITGSGRDVARAKDICTCGHVIVEETVQHLQITTVVASRYMHSQSCHAPHTYIHTSIQVHHNNGSRKEKDKCLISMY